MPANLLWKILKITIDFLYIAWYHFIMVNKDIKQVAVRLTKDQWKAVNHYMTDNEISFQALIIKLLSENLKK